MRDKFIFILMAMVLGAIIFAIAMRLDYAGVYFYFNSLSTDAKIGCGIVFCGLVGTAFVVNLLLKQEKLAQQENLKAMWAEAQRLASADPLQALELLESVEKLGRKLPKTFKEFSASFYTLKEQALAAKAVEEKRLAAKAAEEAAQAHAQALAKAAEEAQQAKLLALARAAEGARQAKLLAEAKAAEEVRHAEFKATALRQEFHVKFESVKEAAKSEDWQLVEKELQEAILKLGGLDCPEKKEADMLLHNARAELKKRRDFANKLQEAQAFMQQSFYDKARTAFEAAWSIWPDAPDDEQQQIQEGLRKTEELLQAHHV